MGLEVAPPLSRLARQKADRVVPVPIDAGFRYCDTVRRECVRNAAPGERVLRTADSKWVKPAVLVYGPD